MPSVSDIVRMSRILYLLDPIPVRIVELEIIGDDTSDVFFDAFRDRVGPSFYFQEDQLSRLRLLREVEHIPVIP